jgi:hypothetical protein
MSYTGFWTRCISGLVLAAATVFWIGVQPCWAQSESKMAGDGSSTGDSLPTIRMRAGSTTPYKDHAGNTWLPDAPTKDGGFEGGDTIDRPDDMEIKNTKDPGLYRSEHYSMDSFSYKLPDGKYIVRLHFAETYDGIAGPGDRVFSFKVQNKEFKDFDIWKKAGGPQRAYVEAVPVDITDGKLKITFTSDVQNPAIDGIEIIPADKATAAEMKSGPDE